MLLEWFCFIGIANRSSFGKLPFQNYYMVKKIMAFACFLFLFTGIKAQLQSPDAFLGYKLGSRYTPHWKIVNYFQQAAAKASSMVKLVQYGESYEGRPLLLAIISSAENMQNLNEIQINNLRLAHLSNDNVAAKEENTPAIVWLSYNVHGNETSSSEASMLTLFDLADPSNIKTKEWLKNTVVIIDPCINPDGRDRYVNWYNSIVGKNYNSSLDARERREPWPGGRTNHYNFDLNRDWAWQTQVESQQRVKVYNEWLPQIHVDYHEQSVNAPYYFAPAAQPYHEVITPWQRDFQVMIGKNNAKYFDSNGWLFFTKEIFDLYYPSYGDTYPLYNGAIGMTYEQAGGPAGGLGVLKDEGDTLTLYDRIIHHHTTGLSTIETSSLNAGRLIKEFHKYFNDAESAGVGEYKTYVIKYEAGNAQQVAALTNLLGKNNIKYGSASGTGKGYNYSSGKDETFSFNAKDIIISAIQPKSALVKVLFEPKGILVDSVTYDITAWSLPYVYGVQTYALKEKITQSVAAGKTLAPAPEKTDYGYVIKWQGMQSVKTVMQLMKEGVMLRFAEQPFEIKGEEFGRGSIIVLKRNNEKFGIALWEKVASICSNENIFPYAVHSGFVDKGFDFGSSKVHLLKTPKVALLTGEGISSGAAGEIWFFFEQQLKYSITLINANDASRANWSNIDVLIMPAGNYRFLNDKKAADDFNEWISKGGKVVALENAVSQLSKLDWVKIKLKKTDDSTAKENKEGYNALKKFEDRERDDIPGSTPGSIFKVELDNSHPLAFGYPEFYYTLKQDNNIYEFMNEAWNVGVIKKDNQVSGFVGSKLKNKLKDGLLFGVQDIGQGTITFLTDNLLFRNFWENGKLMFCNAVFLVGQ